jgi:hypothetical protein
MKINFINFLTATVMAIFTVTSICNGQSDKSVIGKYLMKLPAMNMNRENSHQKLSMTAVYINMDKYGNITSRTKVTGDYTRGLKGGKATWKNVYIYSSAGPEGKYGEGKKQEYMDNFIYAPSSGMMKDSAFATFPKNVESVFARNLIWDMMAIEDFAWKYQDSLELNKNYIISKAGYSFDMAGIGNYSHNNIQIEWTGISQVNNELCAVIDYRSLNNKVEVNIEQVKTKGTEQYWGSTRISLKTGNVLFAEMYSGTLQEAEITGFKDKMVIKTVREIKVQEIK